jgi:hypothetical protein
MISELVKRVESKSLVKTTRVCSVITASNRTSDNNAIGGYENVADYQVKFAAD